ncbi:Uncharacterized protein TCM_022052 [Theobroma cacao]|uniref:Uncharacterized protein n=1 Tax=Theobroma cacao TaxID=3641 RepID=A0A061ESS8_THECC|nr:Uncharacterized protein TCM_022052 [Theobroma cacao]
MGEKDLTNMLRSTKFLSPKALKNGGMDSFTMQGEKEAEFVSVKARQLTVMSAQASPASPPLHGCFRF